MRKSALLCLLVFLFVPGLLFAEGVKRFTLKNGLSVIVWEDSLQSDVYGMVVVKAGSAEEPEQYTGLAHYLEHVMFKGTERIGALDWGAEKPIYEQIIAKYDERANEVDPIKKAAIDKEINELSIQQSKLGVTNEFATLVESIGGVGLNAATSYDFTFFHNSFPAFQLERWLDLNSVRLMNPVFRTFQAELENVYEEYNMYEDSRAAQTSQFLRSKIFQNHPYGRPVTGLGEHLKNPRLSKLIEFYNQYYVPGNMALILVGNIQADKIAPMVSKKFGRLQAKPVPVLENRPLPVISGRQEISVKYGDYPTVNLAFTGIPSGNEDEIVLDVCMNMLSNDEQTGLLDKLALDGDLMYVSSSLNSLREGGRSVISAVPAYDISQRRYESHKSVEKLLLEQLNKLRTGAVENWLLPSVKNSFCREKDLETESARTKGLWLMQNFVEGLNLERVIKYDSLVQSITMEDISMVAKKYLGDDYLAIDIFEGKGEKKEKIPVTEKNKPVESSLGDTSMYKSWFLRIPTGEVKEMYEDMSEVKTKLVNEQSKLFYLPNNQNTIFSMTIKYGVGTRLMPKLELAVPLMNDAGIMASFKPQEFKNELSKLNASCSYTGDKDYTYVTVRGAEVKLKEICQLITRQMLMPALDVKQLNNMKGRMLQTRYVEQVTPSLIKDALKEYMLYHSASSYLERLTEANIIDVTTSELTGEFQRATDYVSEIHYTGNLPFDEVYSILSANLPLKTNEKISESPYIKPRVKHEANKIYFLPNTDVHQSDIYFFVEGPEFSIEKYPIMVAFNQYFDGGFGGLVLNEIREKNSMAYSASGRFILPEKAGGRCHFIGYVGTQNEKVNDVVSLYMNLINNMPQIPERMETVREYVVKSSLSTMSDFRTASQKYEYYKLLGYQEDPTVSVVEGARKMTFNDIVGFYNMNMRGMPVAIGIVGDPRKIDLKKLEKFGKVERLNTGNIIK